VAQPLEKLMADFVRIVLVVRKACSQLYCQREITIASAMQMTPEPFVDIPIAPVQIFKALGQGRFDFRV